MAETDQDGVAIPRGRLSRLARFSGLGTSIAGGMVSEGAKRIARGERIDLRDLLLTPSNATKVADQLSRLRGAAMKLGQLISMDGGDLIPPELAEILAKLRATAHPMPPKQLKAVLTENWGRGWMAKFESFETKPLAAASIGQVHRARTKDGRDLALKIQYPGVAESIDSDVDNVSALINLSRLLPKEFDVGPLLKDAKAQLHQEADYEREGAQLQHFRDLLADDPDFEIPRLHADLTTRTILAMDYVPGLPIESQADAPPEERNRLMTLLIGLVLRELFDFQRMQTDPNFANYRYNPETKKVVLLDFGATRELNPELTGGYRALLTAGLHGARDEVFAALKRMGFIEDRSPDSYINGLMDMTDMGLEPLRHDGVFDFETTDLPERLRDAGMEFRHERKYGPVPQADLLFVQRKIGGMYLLASRLKSAVNIRALLEPYTEKEAA